MDRQLKNSHGINSVEPNNQDKQSDSPDIDNQPAQDQQAPADALSLTPEELGTAEVDAVKETSTGTPTKAVKTKQPSKFRRLMRKANLYFMLFIILLVIAAAIAVITYLYSQKETPPPSYDNQSLSKEDLEKLANQDTSVGSARQRLTIKGDATIEGQTLLRANLDVAGNIQTSGKITGASLTISGDSNLGNTQISSLQVSGNHNVQGDIALGGGLSVTGASTFKGPITASKITASQLVLSGNATLEIPNHLQFTGPTPTQNFNRAVLGSGGSASLSGSDTSGTVNVNSGNNPTGGCFITISFRQAFAKTPHVLVSPIGAAAGKLDFYVMRTVSEFQLCSNNAPTANSNFSFDYFVAG